MSIPFKIVALAVALHPFWSDGAFGDCSTKVGSLVELVPPSSVLPVLPRSDERGEFETTEDYKARIAQANSALSGKRIVVESAYDPEQVHYDADRARFEILHYAWGNTRGSFDRVFMRGNSLGMPRVSIAEEVHGEGLGVVCKIIGTYPAANAFGVTVQVTREECARFGVFDRKIQGQEKTWDLDFPESGSIIDGTHRTSGIYLDSDIEAARALKDKLRFGIEFSPRGPYLAAGSDYWEPKIDRPTERIESIYAFIGDIHCVVVSDQKGTVLRTVGVAYQ